MCLAAATQTQTIRGSTSPAVITTSALSPAELLHQIHVITHNEFALKTSASNDAMLVADSVKCANCGKPGHTKPDCWSKGGGKEGQGPGHSHSWRSKGTGEALAKVAADVEVADAFAFAVNTDFTKASAQSLPRLTCILDSGASQHFDPCCNNFITFREIALKPISSADERVFHTTGEGNVRVMTVHGGKSVQFLLRDVLYAPSIPHALISVSCAAHVGLRVQFEKDSCCVLSSSGQTMFIVPEQQGLYPLLPTSGLSSIARTHALAATTGLTLHELHHRMEHAYTPALKKMVQDDVVVGVHLKNMDLVFCEICAKAKQPREPFLQLRSSPAVKSYGVQVHTDVWGKAPVKTLVGKEYYILFLDDHSDEAVVMLMSRKSDAFARYHAYIAWTKTQCGVVVMQEL